jgi:Na+/H+ antiporter NhaD/arsenite permease-like protein
MNMTLLAALIFVLIYLAISLEEWTRISRISLSLFGAGLLWTLYAVFMTDASVLQAEMASSTLKVAEIVLFLMTVMALVEWIDGYQGFDGLKRLMVCNNVVYQLCRVTGATFLLSSVIDNMTATLLMLTLVKNQFKDRQLHLYFVGMIILASNAGGAWSPIGDVTSSILWIGGKVTALGLIKTGFIPALLSCAIPLLIMSVILWRKAMGEELQQEQRAKKRMAARMLLKADPHLEWLHWGVLILGLCAMVFIPWGASLTGLPPFMIGLLLLGTMGVVVDPLLNLFSQYTVNPTPGKLNSGGLSKDLQKNLAFKQASRASLLAESVAKLRADQSEEDQSQESTAKNSAFLGKEPEDDDEDEDAGIFSILDALREIDFSSILFIAGLLFCMEMLAHTSSLSILLQWLMDHLGSEFDVVLALGLMSSLIDNIPLVSGAMSMLGKQALAQNDLIWVFLAYCAGTGGSIFLVGSSSGVVAMGQEDIRFSWYARHITWIAIVGYGVGALCFYAQKVWLA